MPRISEESIERVAAASDIVEVIGGYFPLKRAGTSWRALCPFHREKSPSFHVSPQKQAYYCFGCGAGGGVFKFVMEYERVDFATAVQRLAQKAGVTIVEETGGPDDDRRRALRDRLLEMHRAAANWFHHNLVRSPAGAAAREYLKSRAIGSDIAKAWQIGYAPDGGGALLAHLRKAGFRDNELRASGLFGGGEDGPMRDRFRQRLMFPICNDYGEVIAFSGRVLPPNEDPAKYVNSPETPLFTKGRALFGLHKARRPLADAGTAIVCEGQLDLIRVFESGLQNVVAPQGTAFTPAQARLLKRYVETAILCFDSDRAGRTAVERSLPILLAAGFSVRVAALPPGEDPDSLIRTKGPDAFRELATNAPDYFEFAVSEAGRDLEDAGKKSALVRKLAGFAASLPDAVGRESVAARIGPRLAISRLRAEDGAQRTAGGRERKRTARDRGRGPRCRDPSTPSRRAGRSRSTQVARRAGHHGCAGITARRRAACHVPARRFRSRRFRCDPDFRRRARSRHPIHPGRPPPWAPPRQSAGHCPRKPAQPDETRPGSAARIGHGETQEPRPRHRRDCPASSRGS
ncbi:MAG: hypothetical protein RIQ71_945 [Verrucomicrobiota bacterium]|jgi:DNA primase